MESIGWMDGGASLGGVGEVVACEGIEVDATVDVPGDSAGKAEGGIVSS